MRQHPAAVLALWNDVDPARDSEYEHWHAVEHAPERVWVPGFLGATRYARCVGNSPQYFTLYEMAGLEALGSREYLDLVQKPTPWSASMRLSMRHFVRKPVVLSTLVGTTPSGPQGGLVTARMVWETPPSAWRDQLTSLANRFQNRAPDVSRVGGGWVTEAGPQAIANESDAPLGHEAVIWAELEAEADPIRLADRMDLLLEQLASLPSQPVWQQTAGYQLLTRIPRSHPPGSPRPAPRLDLMKTYQGDNA